MCYPLQGNSDTRQIPAADPPQAHGRGAGKRFATSRVAIGTIVPAQDERSPSLFGPLPPCADKGSGLPLPFPSPGPTLFTSPSLECDP